MNREKIRNVVKFIKNEKKSREDIFPIVLLTKYKFYPYLCELYVFFKNSYSSFIIFDDEVEEIKKRLAKIMVKL